MNTAPPTGWEIVRLDSLVSKWIGGGTPPRGNIKYWNGDIPWATVKDFPKGHYIDSTAEFINAEGVKNSSTNVVPRNSVVTAVRVGVGKSFVNDIDLAINQDLRGLIPNENVTSDYLMRALNANSEKIIAASSGTTVKGIKLDVLKQLPILLPPKKAQYKISKLLAEVDNCIVSAQRIINHARLMKKGLLHQLLTKGINHTTFKSTIVGEIPDTWRVAHLEELCILQRGFDLPKSMRQAGRVPLVASNGIIDGHSEVKVAGPGVVTGRSGTIGNVFYIEEDFWPLNTTLYVKDFRGNDPLFVFYFLQWFDLSKYVSGTGVPTLNRNLVHPKLIAFPTEIDEQKEIAAMLAATDEVISANIKNKARQEVLKEGLVRDLLTGKVSV